MLRAATFCCMIGPGRRRQAPSAGWRARAVQAPWATAQVTVFCVVGPGYRVEIRLGTRRRLSPSGTATRFQQAAEAVVGCRILGNLGLSTLHQFGLYAWQNLFLGACCHTTCACCVLLGWSYSLQAGAVAHLAPWLLLRTICWSVSDRSRRPPPRALTDGHGCDRQTVALRGPRGDQFVQLTIASGPLDPEEMAPTGGVRTLTMSSCFFRHVRHIFLSGIAVCGTFEH